MTQQEKFEEWDDTIDGIPLPKDYKFVGQNYR
jgi:hypothetical protein